MKTNIIIVKDSLVILPYIKNISNIRINYVKLLFCFEVESMIIDKVLVHSDKFEFDLGKHILTNPVQRLLFCILQNNKDKFYEEHDKIIENQPHSLFPSPSLLSPDLDNLSKEDCYNEFKSKYDDLNDKREKLIDEWDKSLSLLKRL